MLGVLLKERQLHKVQSFSKISRVTDVYINMQIIINTGPQVNVLPESVFWKLQLRKGALLKLDTKLSNYSGSKIQLLRKYSLQCKTNLGNVHKLEFQVTKVSNATPILSLGILKRVEMVGSRMEPQILNKLSRFKHVFQGLVDIKIQPHQFVLKPDSRPPVWLKPIVVVRKHTGELRVHLDPQPLNAAIMREHCRLPTWEEVTLKMNRAQYFSTLDANKGFW
ncbi:hypothetical protein PR048_020997 [Dryococelus australis]|uniref:Uncharacterized protein n=1 Tax=Dryococelus australis TaxID=614101 RepID=A0ABQ9GX03_9NEOP|nr:hypothetical protein PR048_020997 [Dryococelus australis]